jgi:hypothetical protein
MSLRTRARLDGARWLVFALFAPDSRARRSAIEWLSDDAVFTALTSVRTRPRLIPSKAA